MLLKLEIHNFKCFDHFVFHPGNLHSSLIIGRNGSGKSTVGELLLSLRRIASGVNNVTQHLSPASRFDLSDPNQKFRWEFLINGKVFDYEVEAAVTSDGRGVVVSKESLHVDQDPLFVKDGKGNVTIYPGGTWYFDPSDHFVLPLINNPNSNSDIEVFKRFARNILVLKVCPLLMRSDTDGNLKDADIAFANFSTWYLDRFTEYPGVYAKTIQMMQNFVPEFNAIIFSQIAADSKRMFVRFSDGKTETMIPVSSMSDGEKCLLVMSAVGAVNLEISPTLCFWDEPDNFLSKSEVSAAVVSLTSMFENRGQLIITTHEDEAIVKFDRDSTFVFERTDKMSPVVNEVRTLRRLLDEDGLENDLRTSLRMGDIDS